MPFGSIFDLLGCSTFCFVITFDESFILFYFFPLEGLAMEFKYCGDSATQYKEILRKRRIYFE